MAISNTTGFGMRPINKLSGNYNSAGVTKYKSWARDYDRSSDLGLNSPVVMHKLNTISIFGRGQSAGNNQAMLGSFQGINYTDITTGKPVFADHVNGADINEGFDPNQRQEYFIASDPFQLFEMKIDGALTLSMLATRGGSFSTIEDNESYALSSNGKRSEAKLSSAGGLLSPTSNGKLNATTATLQLLYGAETPGEYETYVEPTTNNAYLLQNSNVVVKINNSQHNSPTALGMGDVGAVDPLLKP